MRKRRVDETDPLLAATANPDFAIVPPTVGRILIMLTERARRPRRMSEGRMTERSDRTRMINFLIYVNAQRKRPPTPLADFGASVNISGE